MSRNFELLNNSNNSDYGGVLGPLRQVDRALEESLPPEARSRIGAATRDSEPQAAEWQQFLSVIRKHWRLSAAFAVTVVVCVGTMVLSMKPVYAPTARIEIDPRSDVFSVAEPGSPRAVADTAEYAETKAEDLQSDELAVDVIRKLHLDQSSHFLGRAAHSPELNSQRTTDANSGDFSGTLTPVEHRALRVFKKSLQVQRDSSSRLVNVRFASHDPKLAALVTNTLVSEFIQRNDKAVHEQIAESTRWLSGELQDIRARMGESNRALAEFQQHSGITAISGAQSTFGDRVAELNKQLTLAQAERIQLQALLAKADFRNPDTLSQINADPTVKELAKSLAGARADLSQALTVYGRNHPRVRQLQAQIDELQKQLTAQQKSVFANLTANYGAAKTREGLLDNQLKEVNKQMGLVSEYEALKKEAEANETLYNTLYSRIREAEILAGSQPSNIRWTEHARVLDSPTDPRQGLIMAIGCAFALLGGVALAFIRERLDTTIHTPDDLRSWVSLSNVTVIPLIETARNEAGRHRFLSRALGARQIWPSAFLRDEPRSAPSEAIRGLFTSIQLTHATRPPQALLVASSLPGEGKTTIAANLAIALAHYGNTCIVDLDPRKSGITNVFGLSPSATLPEVLQNSIGLDEALMPVAGVADLVVLAGRRVDSDSAGLVASDQMHNLFLRLRELFRFIVVDSPPLLMSLEARAVSPLVDGTILVGRPGITPRGAIRRSLELLEEVHGAPVVNIVLNGADSKLASYGCGYGSPYSND